MYNSGAVHGNPLWKLMLCFSLVSESQEVVDSMLSHSQPYSVSLLLSHTEVVCRCISTSITYHTHCSSCIVTSPSAFADYICMDVGQISCG